MFVPLLLSVALGQPADPPVWKERFDRMGDLLPAGAVARFGSARFGQGAEILELRISPSGKFVLTRAKEDGFARLCDIDTGREVARYSTKDVAPDRMTFLSETAVAVVGDVVTVWSPGRGGVRLSSEVLPDGTSAAAASADGKRWAFGGEKAIHLMDAESPKEVTRVLATVGSPRGLRFSPDGKWLVAENEKSLSLWDLGTGKRVRTYPTGEGPSVRFDPASTRLYCRTKEVLRCLSLDSDEDADGFAPFEPDSVNLADFQVSKDGGTLLVLSADGTVHPLDAKTGAPGKSLPPPKGVVSWPLAALSADGGRAVSVREGGRWVSWEPATGKHSTAPPADPLHGVWVSPDGKKAISCAEGDHFREWDLADGKPEREWRPRGIEPSGSSVWDPAGGRLLFENEAKEVTCLRVADGEVLAKLPAANEACKRLAFVMGAPNLCARFLAESVELCDLTGKQPARAFRYAIVDHGTAVMSPDGRLLALGGKKDETVVFEAKTGRRRLTIRVRATEMRFAPDGRTLAVGDDGGYVTLIDTAAGRELRKMSLTGSGDTNLAFSRDGKHLVASCRGNDRSIAIWEVATGEMVTEFVGPSSGTVTGVAFAPDGRYVVSCGTDGCAYVWDVRYRRPPEELLPPVAFESVAGARAALASRDGEEAFRAVLYLTERPTEAVRELQSAFPAAVGPIREELAKWRQGLGSKEFKVRDAARKALADAGVAASDALRAEVKEPANPESGRTAADLLAKVGNGYAVPVDLLAARAVEVAERIGNPAAKQLLTAWAGGAELATLTVEAKAALARLK